MIRKRHLFGQLALSLFIFSLLFPTNALAVIIRVPTPEYPTIQAGLTAAVSGDTVLLADGTYTGVGNKNLVIGNGITVKSENGPNNCIIDCEFDGRFHENEIIETVIEGLTIKNGIGGIFGIGMTVKDCVIVNNSGFGVFIAEGPSYIIDSTLSKNGSGIGMIDARGGVQIVNCTISENVNIGVHANDCSPRITNCTLHGNGIGVLTQDFEAFITNSTISGNLIAGIDNQASTYLSNSIVANNLNGDCIGRLITSRGHNLDSDGSCNLTEPGDIPNTNPLLGYYTDDGTPGNGHFPLLEGSPTIDSGDDTACRSTDQIGNPRIDGDGDGEINCDIGAIEYQGPPICNGKPVTILGTEGHDVIEGTAGPDVIHGLGGHDVIEGKGGGDVICGGDGNDTIFGRGGNDIILGGDGHDTLIGNTGDDILKGGNGVDFLAGGVGNDTLRGNGSNDTLNGGPGIDNLWGGGGNDTCYDDEYIPLTCCEVMPTN